nr:immunoglobulin light chain junction region [Macaca mulatta]MOW03393.1 immunoglobulin light chain junction region [Macaca mulatta]MOW03788.1 immunoglobulin light chain junction region [Macaca mulatta]
DYYCCSYRATNTFIF